MKKGTSDTVVAWHVDTAAEGAGEGFDRWIEVSNSFYDLRALEGSEAFEGIATGYLLDKLMFIDARFDGLQVGRSARHLSSEPSDYLFLHMFESGSMTGLLDEMPISKQPGQVAVQDFSRELYAVAEPSKVKAVAVPFDVLGYERGRHKPFVNLPMTELKGRVIADATQTIFNLLPGVNEVEAPAMAESYAGMLRAMLFGSDAEADRRSKQKAQLTTILSYIDQQVRDPDLDTEMLCEVFNISRAKLFRILQSQGGVLRAIQQRRLHRCFHELCLRDEKTTVRCIAERYGFMHPSHFNRLFKQLFFLSPSEVRPLPEMKRCRRSAASKAVNTWLKRHCAQSALPHALHAGMRTAAE